MGSWVRSWRAGVLAMLTGAVAAVGMGVVAGPASATGPGYPGETLAVAQNPSAAGQETSFTATGSQPDFAAGGYGLDVWVKLASVDPTCAGSYTQEETEWSGDLANEFWVVQDGWLGDPEASTTFSYPFNVLFDAPGSWVMCAYMTWVTDTAASATLNVNVSAASGAGGGGGGSGGTTTPKPTISGRPTVTRSGSTLRCAAGTWTGASTYAYAWLVSGKAKKGASRKTLRVTDAIKGHSVACRVTASNSAGSTTATSREVHVSG
jgi:hypothetical protein